MCFNSWCRQDSFGSHCGQHKSLPLPFFHVEQLQTGSSHVITPLLHVQILHGWLCGETRSPSGISMSSNMQPMIERLRMIWNVNGVIAILIMIRIRMNPQLTQTAWIYIRFERIRWIIAYTFEMAIIIDTRCRGMAAMHAMIAFVDVMTFVVMRFVAWFTLTVIPTRHINAIRWRFACVQTCCTFI